VTRPQLVVASAPGKLVLMGEYAVLRGHEAIVAAVDVRATARVQGLGPLRVNHDEGGLLQACLDELAALGVRATGDLAVDTSAFRDDADQKLGLGSSAAACVATVHALLQAGANTSTVDVDFVHAAAQRAHRRFQRGRGSGIDVAASAWGGTLRFRRRGDDVDVEPAPRLPATLEIMPVWTGRPQDTRDFVGAVLALPDVDDIVAPLARATAGFVAACAAADDIGVLAAVDEARAGMASLGDRAGIDVVAPPHARVAALAAEHGGAAKPSGAGGGDVALAFVPRARAPALRAACLAAGLPPLLPRVGDGVRGVDNGGASPAARGATPELAGGRR